MTVAVLFPSYDHQAIEERYASWQAELRLRGAGTRFYYYPAGAAARDVSGEVEEEYVLVVTDPLALAPPGLAGALHENLGTSEAAVPVANVAANRAQAAALPAMYMTLRELDLVMEQMRNSGAATEEVVWDQADPAMFFCRTETLDEITAPLPVALTGRRVALMSKFP